MHEFDVTFDHGRCTRRSRSIPQDKVVPLPLRPRAADVTACRRVEVSFDDVRAAAERLRGVAHRTPVVTSRTLDVRTGARAFLKAENFQRMGAFKFRGAYNRLAQLDARRAARGVVAFSSGNHAQGVALARATARRSGDHRDAGRCAGVQARGDARLRCRGRDSTIASAMNRSEIAARSRANAARRSCRRTRSGNHRRAGNGRARADRRRRPARRAARPPRRRRAAAGCALAATRACAGRARLRRRAGSR